MSGALGSHPSPEKLAAFRVGDVTPDEFTEVERHLSACPSCCQGLKSLPDDSLVRVLRRSFAANTVQAEQTPADSSPPADAGPRPAEDGLPASLRDHPRYRVLELLGAGGMGAVYRAEHLVMQRTVALKVISRRLSDRPAVVERFRREVRAAARLAHPNIVTAHDADRAGDTHFLVMEFVEGTTLARLVQERGPLPVAEACDYVRQAALGLQHALERGMVHRDVKPHNLMVTPGGGVKVLDFGLARLASELAPADAATDTGVVLGTADYIAPEQAEDPRAADTRADIYSLGCTLYFLLTGRPPFPEGTLMQKLMAHGRHTPRPVSAFRADVPPGLAEALGRMTAKDPARRHQTPGEVAAALAPFSRTTPAGVTTVEAVRPARRPRRVWPAVAALLGLLLLGGGLLGVFVYRVATDRGEFVVEVSDPAVEVMLAEHGLTVHDKATGRKYVLKPGRHDLPSGDYEIDVTEEAGGLDFSTREFRITRGDERRVKVTLNLSAARVGEVRRIPAHSGQEGVWGVALSPDGRRAVSCGEDCFVRCWELATGKQLWAYDSQIDNANWRRLRDVAISPDGRLALVAAYDFTVRILDMATGKEVRRFEGHKQTVHSVSFSSDGRLAVSASHTWDPRNEQDSSVRVWEVATGKELQKFEAVSPKAAVLSPDGALVLSGDGDNVMRAWDAKTGKELRRFEGHAHRVLAVALSPDGRRALSGSWDNSVRLWDVNAGKELRTFEGHADKVQAVAFMPDGRRALSAAEDGTLRLWDLESGRELFRFEGHRGRVHTAAVSADGRYALSGGTDGTVRLWRLPDPPPEGRPREAP